jgi:hypothetical protein
MAPRFYIPPFGQSIKENARIAHDGERCVTMAIKIILKYGTQADAGSKVAQFSTFSIIPDENKKRTCACEQTMYIVPPPRGLQKPRLRIGRCP